MNRTFLGLTASVVRALPARAQDPRGTTGLDAVIQERWDHGAPTDTWLQWWDRWLGDKPVS
jgi:hypothetical protein